MEPTLWYHLSFWDFIKEFTKARKYDDTCKVCIVFQSVCSTEGMDVVGRARSVKFVKPARLVSFLENLSTDLYDCFSVVHLSYSGRYTPCKWYIRNSEFV